MRAPGERAVAERVPRTLRNAYPNHLIIRNKQHLWAMCAECVQYDTAGRTHWGLLLGTLRLALRTAVNSVYARLCSVASIMSSDVPAEQRPILAPYSSQRSSDLPCTPPARQRLRKWQTELDSAEPNGTHRSSPSDGSSDQVSSREPNRRTVGSRQPAD